jgi:hypothetical protein
MFSNWFFDKKNDDTDSKTNANDIDTNKNENIQSNNTVVDYNKLSPLIHPDWLSENEPQLKFLKQYKMDEQDDFKFYDTSPYSYGPLTFSKEQKIKALCNILSSFAHPKTDLASQQTTPILFLYFISLKNDKLFLYASANKNKNEILYECLEKFDYVKQNPPLHVIYTEQNFDFFDVDKYVKWFMYDFGIENTRGGAYTDVELDNNTLAILQKEFDYAKQIMDVVET